MFVSKFDVNFLEYCCFLVQIKIEYKILDKSHVIGNLNTKHHSKHVIQSSVENEGLHL